MSKLVKCEICGKIFSEPGMRSHKWRVHGDGRNFKPTPKGTIPWNKGLTRETSSIVNDISTKLERAKTRLESELDDDGKLLQRWRNKCVNAKADGLKCNLTFDEYCKLVKDAGLKSSQLGFSGDGFVLARYNDIGNYEVGNCRFITQQENSDEKNERLFHQPKRKFVFEALVRYFNDLDKQGIDP